MEKPNMRGILFKGYVTNNPSLAHDWYVEKTGVEPTLLVHSPNGSPLIGDYDNLVVSKFCPANAILITHLVTPTQFMSTYGGFNVSDSVVIPDPIPDFYGRKLSELSDRDTSDNSVRTRPRGGATKSSKSASSLCPHCQQKISDFNNLGWWYGWNLGIEPPYWEELRMYVFSRDNFMCTECRKKFPTSGLAAHHIIPKETGGANRAKKPINIFWCVLVYFGGGTHGT